MTSLLYVALLLLAAPGAFVAGWRARGRRDWRIEVPRSLVVDRMREMVAEERERRVRGGRP